MNSDDPKKPRIPVVIDVTAERVGEVVDAPPRIGTKNNSMRFRIALALAMAIDLLQIVFALVFSEGFLSPAEDILDVMAFFVFTSMLGWHFMFLPGFIFELVPILDLAPTWTIAVGLAIRSKQKKLQ